MSTKAADAPEVSEWPALAGWFGLVLALVWLVAPASFGQPLPALTVVLAGCWLFGLYQHLRHVGYLTWLP